MPTVIVFPDAELWVCTYLRAQLPLMGYVGVYVSNQRGTEPVAVWVRRDGGGTLDLTREAPRLGVNVYDTTEQKVTDLASMVAALLVACPDGKPVLRATEITGPTPIADASPRRFVSVELVVRGVQTPAS